MKHEAGSGGDQCEVVRPLLSLLVDKESTPEETALAKSHLQQCEQCASQMAFLKAMNLALGSAPVEVPSSALYQRIAMSTYNRPTFWDRVRQALAPAPTRLALGSAFAVAIVGLVTFPHWTEMSTPQTSVPIAQHPVREVKPTQPEKTVDPVIPETAEAPTAVAVNPPVNKEAAPQKKQVAPPPATRTIVAEAKEEEPKPVKKDLYVPVSTPPVLAANTKTQERSAVNKAPENKVPETKIIEQPRQIARLNAATALSRQPITQEPVRLEPTPTPVEPVQVATRVADNSTAHRSVITRTDPGVTIPDPAENSMPVETARPHKGITLANSGTALTKGVKILNTLAGGRVSPAVSSRFVGMVAIPMGSAPAGSE